MNDTNPSVNAAADTKIKLPPWRKIAYAVTDGANNLSYTFVASFFLFFATNIYGISAAVVATLILIGRLWDAVADPFIGGLADRTRTKWGSYRPWILFGSIPLCVLNFLAFSSIPIEGQTGKTVFMCVVFIVLVTCYSCVNIPYSAATAVLTTDTDERASITSYRLMAAVLVGSLILGQATLPLVSHFGGGSPMSAVGWRTTALIYSACALVLYIISFFGIKEVVKPHAEKQSFRMMFRAMTGNGPAWILGFGFLVMGLFINGRQAVLMYYFTYNAGDPNLFTKFMLFYAAANILGVFLVPLLGTRMKNKATLPKWGFIFSGILMVILFFVNPLNSWGLFIALNMLLSGVSIGAMTMMYGMMPDCTEYGEHKTGIRAAGFISAFMTFLMKVGMAVGISGVGFALAATGFDAAKPVQSDLTLGWINAIMNLLPGILSIISGLIFFGYKLDRKSYYQMLDEIEANKA